MEFRINIEVLENGFEVEVPDAEKCAEKEAAAKKSKQDYPVYTGDCTKKYAAKSTAEVLKLVKDALMSLPHLSFEDAFEEATKANKD